MTQIWHRLVCARVSAYALAALTTLSTPLCVQAAESTTDATAEVNLQLERVAQAIRDIEQWLQQSRQQRSAEEAALSETDRQLGEIRRNIELTRDQQQQQQQQIERLDADLSRLLAESAEQREQLASAQKTLAAGGFSNLLLQQRQVR